MINSLIINFINIWWPRFRVNNVWLDLTNPTHLIIMPCPFAPFAFFHDPRAYEWVMRIILTFTNMTTKFLIELKKTMHVLMTTFKAFSAFLSFVFFLFIAKNYFLYLISFWIKKSIEILSFATIFLHCLTSRWFALELFSRFVYFLTFWWRALIASGFLFRSFVIILSFLTHLNHASFI